MQILKDQNMIKEKKAYAIVLAAGKGKRMNATRHNKVVTNLGNKPMILHGIELLKKLNIKKIIVVVGFAKESVKKILNHKVLYALQRKRLGTGHAVSCALKKLPKNATDVIVVNGDDSAFYTKTLLNKLKTKHFKSNADFTLLTIEVKNPHGLGRIIRDKKGKLISILEEKDASSMQKKVKEINPQCFMFKVDFLRKYLKKIEKNKVTGEYYLTSLISIGMKSNAKIETLAVGKIPWRGVNTTEELRQAEKMLKKTRKKQ